MIGGDFTPPAKEPALFYLLLSMHASGKRLLPSAQQLRRHALKVASDLK